MPNKLYKSSALYCVCQIYGWFFVLCVLILCFWLCFGSFETVCHLLWNEGLMLELAECRIQATKKYWENGSISKNFSFPHEAKEIPFFFFFLNHVVSGTIFLNCTSIRIPRLPTYALKQSYWTYTKKSQQFNMQPNNYYQNTWVKIRGLCSLAGLKISSITQILYIHACRIHYFFNWTCMGCREVHVLQILPGQLSFLIYLLICMLVTQHLYKIMRITHRHIAKIWNAGCMLWIVKVRAAVYWRKEICTEAPSSVIPCCKICHKCYTSIVLDSGILQGGLRYSNPLPP